MRTISTLIRDHRALALLLLAVTLCVKAVVPQGYMLGSGQKLLTVQLCYDGSEHRTAQVAIALDNRPDPADPNGNARPDQHCAFTSLTMGALGGADAPLLEQALIFIIARGFAPVTLLLPERSLYLRPPLRGPPASF